MKKIYYIGHYSDPSGNSKRKTAPAADTKMDYIISSLKKVGYDVEVLSFCVDDDRKSVFEKKWFSLQITHQNFAFSGL